LFLLSYLRKE